MQWSVYELQRENVLFATKAEAVDYAKARVNDLVDSGRQRGYKICKVGSVHKEGDCILAIGSKYGYNWWSRIGINKA